MNVIQRYPKAPIHPCLSWDMEKDEIHSDIP